MVNITNCPVYVIHSNGTSPGRDTEQIKGTSVGFRVRLDFEILGISSQVL